MNRRSTWGIATILIAGLTGIVHAAERPNIILVMADDQGWGDTGYNGHPFVKTPAMDAMDRGLGDAPGSYVLQS